MDQITIFQDPISREKVNTFKLSYRIRFDTVNSRKLLKTTKQDGLACMIQARRKLTSSQQIKDWDRNDWVIL